MIKGPNVSTQVGTAAIYKIINQKKFNLLFQWINVYIPKAKIVEQKVIMMERSSDPPKRKVHMLELPPPGLAPFKNIPNCRSGFPGKNNLAKPKAIWNKKWYYINNVKWDFRVKEHKNTWRTSHDLIIDVKKIKTFPWIFHDCIFVWCYCWLSSNRREKRALFDLHCALATSLDSKYHSPDTLQRFEHSFFLI